MAEAKCLNEDCGKGTWTLRKPVSEYNGINCPKCGTTRTEVVGGATQPESPPNSAVQPAKAVETGEQQAQQESHQQAEQQAQQAQQAGLPQNAQQQSAGETALANPSDMAGFGEEVGGKLAQMEHASPKEKAQVRGTLFDMAGRVLSGYGRAKMQSEMENMERAETRGNETLQRSERYPECPDCGGQITGLPAAGTEFACPHCGTRLVS